MTRVLKLSLAATFIGQLAFAQPAPAPTPAPAAPTAPEGTLSVPQRSTLTPQDMLNQANEYRTKANQTLQRISGMVEQARKDRDIIRVNCLTDKVVQVKANLAVVEVDTQGLQEAGARRDDASALHHFTRITIANQKIDVLGAEAEACVGEDLTFVGQTRVDVQYTGQPTPDTTLPPPPTLTFDRPPQDRPPASPFR